MNTIVVEAKDVSARFDELLVLAEQGADVVIRSEGASKAHLVPITRPARSLGLHLGAMETSPDFNDPLREDVWMGKS
jgi:antitoxin (DNA-binding transcriptional repressor) of toxin-antitoxin stability system